MGVGERFDASEGRVKLHMSGDTIANNSQTYSGMITPSAAPRRRPVPKEDNFDICAPLTSMSQDEVCPRFSTYSLENANNSGRVPKAKEVRPSNPERVKRTYNEDIVLVGV